MFLGLYSPKHENFLSMNTCHLHIGHEWAKILSPNPNPAQMRSLFLMGKANKLDPTAAQYFWLVDHNDWSRWFVISSSHVSAVRITVLLVGLPNLDI
jgi:hypothetical protein